MQEKSLTPARMVLIGTYLLLDDVDFDQLLEHAGIPQERVEDIDGVISIEDTCRLMQSSIELTEDPALGLHLGQEIAVEMLDMVGMMIANAPDLRNAIQLIAEYSPLVSTLAHVELQEQGQRTRVLLHQHEIPAAMRIHAIAEVCSSAFFCMARRLLAGSFTLRCVRSRLPTPPWESEYAAVFGADVEFIFDADEDSIEFDSCMLNLPLKRHSPGLYQQLRAQAARQLASHSPQGNTTDNVRRIIDDLMGQQLLDLPTIAERMGLTPRTLQRHLKEENTTFQAVYDGLRQQHARSYLCDGNGDIETLATILGYSEPANFYRAFKNWFGMSPGEFRRRHRSS